MNDLIEVLQDLSGPFMTDQQREVLYYYFLTEICQILYPTLLLDKKICLKIFFSVNLFHSKFWIKFCVKLVLKRILLYYLMTSKRFLPLLISAFCCSVILMSSNLHFSSSFLQIFDHVDLKMEVEVPVD